MDKTDLKYSTFHERFKASVIDYFIFLPVSLIGMIGSYFLRLSPVYLLIPNIAFNVWFRIYLVKKNGGTPGKRICHLRIKKLDGSPVDWKNAIARDALDTFFYLSQLLALCIVVSQMTDTDYFALEYIDRLTFVNDHASSWSKIIENVSFAWVALDIVVFLASEKRRALHDLIAGTVVVSVEPDAKLQ